MFYVQRKNNLTVQQSQKLLSNILIGFNFKILSNNEIQYNPNIGYITDITGIDHTNCCINIPTVDMHEQQLDSKQCMGEIWEKYISGI